VGNYDLKRVCAQLGRAGIGAVKLVGGMPRIARDNAVSAFTSNPAIRVLLVSLKAGGEGLNLQIADHVFLIDPWWNPASEMQAMDRAHRIGQTREVTAVRFLMRDTIEDRILELQAKKQLAISGTIDGDASAVKQLSKEDLCFLFNR
jgi:DNA repair protein RAD16